MRLPDLGDPAELRAGQTLPRAKRPKRWKRAVPLPGRISSGAAAGGPPVAGEDPGRCVSPLRGSAPRRCGLSTDRFGTTTASWPRLPITIGGNMTYVSFRRGVGCLATLAGAAAAGMFGGWQAVLAGSLMILGGKMLQVAVFVRPGPYSVPDAWMRDPAYQEEVRRKRISMAVIGVMLIAGGIVACPRDHGQNDRSGCDPDLSLHPRSPVSLPPPTCLKSLLVMGSTAGAPARLP